MATEICKETKKRICLVSLLILATLLCWAMPVCAIAKTGIHHKDKKLHHIADSTDISTISDDMSGMRADGDGTIISAGDGIVITTKGKNASGAYADDSGAIRIGDSADITTSRGGAHGALASGDSSVVIGVSADITTSGDKAYGAFAMDGSSITISSDATITTSGNESFGAFAKSSDITIGSNADITTEKTLAFGIYAYNSSDMTIGSSVDITTSGRSAYGAYAQQNSSIKISNSAKITTLGIEAYGAIAVDRSSMTIGSSAVITTSERTAHGALAHGSDMTIGSSANIITSGNGAHGAFAWSNSNMKIGDSAHIRTSGGLAHGALASGDASMAIGNSARITTEKDSARGAIAVDSSDITIGGSVDINTSGEFAHGALAMGSSNMTIGNSADITTRGQGASGAYAISGSKMTIGSSADINTLRGQSFGALAETDSSMDIGNSAKITTSGDLAHGAFATGRSDITIGSGAVISTKGSEAFGAVAFNSSDMTISSNAAIITSGGKASGAVAHTSSDVTFGSEAIIITSGDGSHGAYAQLNSSIDLGADAKIYTTGNEAHAVYAKEKASIKLAGAAISATNRGAFAMLSERGSRVTGSGKFKITGDMVADGTGGTANTVIDLTLENGSIFTGKTSYTSNDTRTELNLTLKGTDTRWAPTGNSELTKLYMNGATVDLTQLPSLSVTTTNLGQSDTDSGTFIMRAGVAGQKAEQLIVTGTAKGKYTIDVINAGKDAATRTEMTDLVRLMTDGQTAAFELAHDVERGGWQFIMLDELPGQLHSDGQASTAGSGAVNSFAGSYLMAYAETNTLTQRTGGLRQSPYSNGLWFRAHGGKLESSTKSYARGFDMKYGGVQIGYDRKLENKWDGDLYLGTMFGYSKSDLDYYSEGGGGVDSKALGVYGVYVRPDGFYIDAILKYQWMTNNFDVIDTEGTLVRGGDVNTGGIGASVEVGQRFRVAGSKESGGGWYVEPQIQFSYQRVDCGYFTATNGLHIGTDSFKSLLGRIGVLVGYETEKNSFYGKVSKVKEFDGNLTIQANGVPIAENFGGSWWVYGIGFKSRINDRNSLHLDVERTSGGSFSQPWRVNAGWRMEF